MQAWDWIESGYQLEAPVGIRINESGKYPEIIGYIWPQPKEQAA